MSSRDDRLIELPELAIEETGEMDMFGRGRRRENSCSVVEQVYGSGSRSESDVRKLVEETEPCPEIYLSVTAKVNDRSRYSRNP